MPGAFERLLDEGIWPHAIIGLAGPRLRDEERALLRRAAPQGVILFARNIESPKQVRALIEDARDACGEYLWAAIDEEGGRVHRLRWPPFCDRAPAASWGERWQSDPKGACAALRAECERVAEALVQLGITHNCAPVLDLFDPTADAVIGDRAFSSQAACVAELGVAAIEGLHAAGIAAVGKHFPGHGRAPADSHSERVVVDAPASLLLAEAEPFRVAIEAGLLHLMTAHIVYPAADDQPATFSELWLQGVLRVRFAFSGTIWSDDLSMAAARIAAAPEADPCEQTILAARRALDAGCDVVLLCDPALWLD